MARKNSAVIDTDEDIATGTDDDATTGEETMLNGMPADPDGEDGEATTDTVRPTVPKHLRALFNEIGRLSGILSIARRAVYANEPVTAVKALRLLEGQTPAACEVAELSV